MPRYNIKHKDKYYVFSSIVDAVIEEFDTFEKLQQWRLEEYGRSEFNNEKKFEELRTNKMEFKEMFVNNILGGNENIEDIVKYYSLLDEKDKIEVFKDLVIFTREIQYEWVFTNRNNHNPSIYNVSNLNKGEER